MRYIATAAETHIHNDTVLDLENTHGLHNLNFAAGYFGKKVSSTSTSNDFERISNIHDCISLVSTKISGTGRSSRYGPPYCLLLGVPKFAGPLGNAKLKLEQHISLHQLYHDGMVSPEELVQWHSKFQHYIEKLDKLSLEVAVNGAHRKVLESLASVNKKDIVSMDCIDTILSTESRSGKGQSKSMKKGGSIEHNRIGESTVAHASTLSLNRDKTLSAALKSTFSHLNISSMVFKGAYDSLYHYKDIKSVEQFAKYLPECFHPDKVSPLGEDKMPFVLTNSPGTLDYVATPKTNMESHFPTLQEIESVLAPSVLNMMFVITESPAWSNHKSQRVPPLQAPPIDAMPSTMEQDNTIEVMRVLSNDENENCIVKLGDKIRKDEKWILQEAISDDARNLHLDVGTAVNISRFSSSHKELVVVPSSDSYASFSINWKKFEIKSPPTPEEAELTPPEI